MASMTDAERVAALRRYQVLDTDPDPRFQAITNTAAIALDVPIALVTLVDESRQWFKARHGLDVCETEREISFCTHAIVSTEPFIVEDAASHSVFKNNPLVTGHPFIRFYAGIPLIDKQGAALGTFCIIDAQPRTLKDDELTMLFGFAQFAMTALTAHRQKIEMETDSSLRTGS